MEDKRKNNGGNSTKSNKLNDKRKSVGKELADKYASEVSYKEYKDLMSKLLKLGMQGDTRASSIWLDRVVGKPKETKDITSNGNTINIPLIEWADDKD